MKICQVCNSNQHVSAKFKPKVQQAKSIAEDTVEPNPIDTSNWGK